MFPNENRILNETELVNILPLLKNISTETKNEQISIWTTTGNPYFFDLSIIGENKHFNGL